MILRRLLCCWRHRADHRLIQIEYGGGYVRQFRLRGHVRCVRS